MSPGAIRKTPWFAYFPDNYGWSFHVAITLSRVPSGAAETAEVFEVCRRLSKKVGDSGLWLREWARMGDRLRSMALAESRRGRPLTAAGYFYRANTYYQNAERMYFPKSAKTKAMYKKSIDCFNRYLALTDRPRAERVEIPFEGKKKLPAYLIHAENTRKARPPVVLLYAGFEASKEVYFALAGEALARRGMSVLVPDAPGVGESIRFRGIHLRHDYEVAGSAILDYLEGRRDLNAKRAGIMAASLGGYYAPRTASLEKRFKACVAWGAQWDYHAIWKRRLEAAQKTRSPASGHHLAWSFNAKTPEEGLQRLKAFRLDGVVQRMRCPFLLVHGKDDQQIPLSHARALFAAVGSKDKTLRLFSGTDGGSQHCHMDYASPPVNFMADWLREKLRA